MKTWSTTARITLGAIALWLLVALPTGVVGAATTAAVDIEPASDVIEWLFEPVGADEPLFGNDNLVDDTFEAVLGWKNKLPIPIKFGAWHWFAQDLNGPNSGYGVRGLRGTYWYEVIADPSFELSDGRKVGAHLNYRLRDGDHFRSFFDSNFWSYEAYGYISDESLGTLKAGQIWKRFGLDWDGVFFGNVAYFDGFKLDPDYGVSWEKTTVISDSFKLDSFVQYYFHEDGVNGSFGGADAESVAGYTERNTGNIRLVPTWTMEDGSTFTFGLSALAGQLQSRRADVASDNTFAWAMDATYTRGRWKMFGEVLQSYGVINPKRFVSGGPSNKITDFLVGAHYKVGPVTYRCSYSLGLDDNPYGLESLVVGGATIKLTKYVDLYVEYVNQQVSNNSNFGHATFFDSLNFIINWSF